MGNRAGSTPVIPTNSMMNTLVNIGYVTSLGIILLLLVLVTLLTFFILNLAFNRRQNNHPYLRYFTAKDFPNLEADEVEFTNRRHLKLRGAFYYYDQKKTHQGLIVFPHGIGAGHHAYMHLIEQFAQKGFIVFSYDNTGCELSEGSSIRGIPQAILDLEDALHYLEKTTYTKYPWFVVGHSWGAYASLRSSFLSPRVLKVVAIAPFDDVGELLGKYLPIIRFVKPFITLIHRIKFPGKWTYQRSSTLLKKIRIPHLIISGENDDDIPLKGNYQRFLKVSQRQQNLTVYLAKNHRHNPYLTFEAENYIIDTILKGTQEMAMEVDPQKRDQFFHSLDYSHIANHDENIINLVVDYLTK